MERLKRYSVALAGCLMLGALSARTRSPGFHNAASNRVDRRLRTELMLGVAPSGIDPAAFPTDDAHADHRSCIVVQYDEDLYEQGPEVQAVWPGHTRARNIRTAHATRRPCER